MVPVSSANPVSTRVTGPGVATRTGVVVVVVVVVDVVLVVEVDVLLDNVVSTDATVVVLLVVVAATVVLGAGVSVVEMAASMSSSPADPARTATKTSRAMTRKASTGSNGIDRLGIGR